MIRDLETKTYLQLEELLSEKQSEYRRIENECISKKMIWDNAVSVIRPVAKDIFSINEQIRLIKEPSFQIGEPSLGEIYPIRSFINLIKTGRVADSTGYGRYAASKNAISDIPILVADVINNKYRRDLGYILWIEK